MNAKIVISFAMIHGGHEFATWLRDRLMKSYGLHAVDAVYVDTFASRYLPADRAADLRVAIDERDDRRSPSGAYTIGARRNDWDDLFVQALRTAKAVIIAATEDYWGNANCAHELDQMREEVDRRRAEGLGELRLVAVNLVPSDLDHARAAFPDATVVNAFKDGDFLTRNEPLLWDRGDWKVTDRVLQKITRAIGVLP